MPKRIDRLTPEQEARMGSFAQEWIERGWRTGPLTEEEWGVWEAGARRCYEFAGIPWPGVVVRVASPMVGAFAAPASALALELVKGQPVGDAVRDAVGGAVRGAVDGAVRGAVRGAVGGAVRDAVGGAVGGAVDGAVRGAVRDAVGDAANQVVESLWHCRLGGRWWAGWWQAYSAYFRDVAALDLDGDLWDRSRAYEDASTAGWWWPFHDFVMVSDVPTELHLEQIAPTGWGSHRLHSETGPAVAWSNGDALYFWHGTQVPADLVTTGWSVEQILREDNAEVRRCAIERNGWDWFVDQAGLAQVGEAVADPGNPGQVLALYDLPAQIFDEPVRVLLCTNGTPERDGTRRRFGLTVPGSIGEPIAAAGWTFGLNPSEYRALERAT